MISAKDTEMLIRYLSVKYGISEAAAKNLIHDFLFDLNYKLAETETIHVEGMGTFSSSLIERADGVKLKQLTYLLENSDSTLNEATSNELLLPESEWINNDRLSFEDIVQRELKEYTASRKNEFSTVNSNVILSSISFAQIFKVLAVCTLIGACIYLFFILSDDTLYEYEKFDEPIISNNLEMITPLKTQSEFQPITLEQAIKSRDSVLRHQEIMGLVSVDSMLNLHEVGSG